jgi:hypothetical protein
MVPSPHEWPGLIQKVHLGLGHFGVKHTYSLFIPHYHWKGMYRNLAFCNCLMQLEICRVA